MNIRQKAFLIAIKNAIVLPILFTAAMYYLIKLIMKYPHETEILFSCSIGILIVVLSVGIAYEIALEKLNRQEMRKSL